MFKWLRVTFRRVSTSATFAMHMSDGIVDARTSALFGVIALAGVGYSAWRARAQMSDRSAPLAGLVAAFIFAVQMANFPVLPGVSGHLLGGALAALLVGPWLGALCVSIVLVVQALVFADGGVTALGANITNMAVLGTAAAYGLAVVLLRVLPRTVAGLGLTGFVAAMVSVVVVSQGFVLQYALGGTTELAGFGLGAVSATMAGTHLLIGIGEGLITATTVMTVARTRPDLVYALRGRRTAPVEIPAVAVTGGAR